MNVTSNSNGVGHGSHYSLLSKNALSTHSNAPDNASGGAKINGLEGVKAAKTKVTTKAKGIIHYG